MMQMQNLDEQLTVYRQRFAAMSDVKALVRQAVDNRKEKIFNSPATSRKRSGDKGDQ